MTDQTSGVPARIASPTNDQLEAEIMHLAARIAAATYRLLALIAEFDARNGWSDWGVRSCAHWLNWRCGIGMNAAREKVRVARSLAELPKISAAFERGEVSYAKVRAMTRVATPDNENYLLNIARHGTAAHVEGLVRRFGRVNALKDANSSHASRAVNCYTDVDGSLVFHGRLTAEQGVLLLKALDAAKEALWEDSEPNHVNNRADALAVLAESFLANGAQVSTGGDKYQVVVHVEQGHAHLEDGPSVSAETFERLACDCSVVEIHEDADGNPLNIGRKSRSIPPAMRRALKHRDGGCRYPGCTATRFVDGHHIRHWSEGGETGMDNLVLLCRHHHRLVHERGFGCLRTPDGQLCFTTPAGARIPDVIPMSAPEGRTNLPLVAHGGRPGWRGEQMDWGMVLEGLLRATSPTRTAAARAASGRTMP